MVKNCERGLIANRKGDLYYVPKKKRWEVNSRSLELMKWNEQFGHLNAHDVINVFQKNIVYFLKNSQTGVKNCEICLNGKCTAKPGRATCGEVLKIGHAGIIGSLRNQSE